MMMHDAAVVNLVVNLLLQSCALFKTSMSSIHLLMGLPLEPDVAPAIGLIPLSNASPSPTDLSVFIICHISSLYIWEE